MDPRSEVLSVVGKTAVDDEAEEMHEEPISTPVDPSSRWIRKQSIESTNSPSAITLIA